MADRFTVDGDIIVISDSYTCGKKNNKHQSGGLYNGSGKIAGYVVVNLSAGMATGGIMVNAIVPLPWMKPSPPWVRHELAGLTCAGNSALLGI
ncbi:hypothetical protein [Methylobacillus rhizosphaerae]|uniref:hypothetical protein n=1 Tax=Methylobacillus rhizosphaerae TaxID=551994 RepID=UPI000B78AF8A|nr:hypothetical protein [Methylobacillus rhizosphaerae]